MRTARENALEVLSYAISFGAFYLFIFFAKRAINRPSFHATRDAFSRLIHSCVQGPAEGYEKGKTKSNNGDGDGDDSEEKEESFLTAALHLAFCVVGIQVSYLLWGLMQERIMTKPYESGELFKSSKFLVFANRFLALIVAWTTYKIQESRGTTHSHSAPLYVFSYSSVSNILSSVSQYEALKYVSFPTQVVAKSCKMVPVMLMGYVVSRKRYTLIEYLIAIAVTSGAAIFKLYEVNDAPERDTQFIGIAFIMTYMVCDSFTSNWQSKVFKSHGVDSITMMMYANMFSTGFTSLGLLVTLEILPVMAFLGANPSILPHMGIMAVCSAVGQLFIFHTIKQYGPLVFATIQTVRQLLSIVLSIFFFGHEINAMEALGVSIVFVALGVQIVNKYQARYRKKPTPKASPQVLGLPPREMPIEQELEHVKEVQSLLPRAAASATSRM